MTGVEAAAISALVSGTLKVVGSKLAPLLIKEYSSIVGVKEDLQELHDLVEEINFWLEKTAENSIGSTQSFAWLKKLNDISYDVDDVVDEFQLKAEKHDSNGDSGIVSKYLCTIPKSFVFQCNSANKIKAIKKRFAAIVKQRTDYQAITKGVDPPVQLTNMRTKEVASLPNVDEALVVGRDKDKQEIISMLEENDDQQKIKIVSVIGLGGSGKTTLAKLVFNDGNIIERHLFEVRLWVHVSKEFVVNDLIKKLFEAFSDNNPGTHALPYMNQTILDKLKGKRFLLVLDDVWTNSRDEWEEFMVRLKVGAPKSRILLTTRNREVAVIVGSTNQFYLPFLSPDDSWKLFQQSLVTPPAGWDFEEVGKAIVDKCGGVPLAIKVLAGALHGKERIEEWQVVRKRKLLNVDGKEDRVAACLRLSYSHLPFNLKQCFKICSLFPKGHGIDKEQLIDLWIAHDMIAVEDGVDCLDLEHVGHNHFESLLQVYFLQIFYETDGRVTCGMHDLVHDLALSILGDEISLDMPSSTTKSYRYFSLIKQTEHMAPKFFFRKARAVYMPKYEDYIYAMALKHAKHLRSVTVGYLNAEGANTISQVKYLKYLAMSLRDCETLPKGISDVWSLQALHVTSSYSLIKIPESIGKLKKLRTLNLSGCILLKSLPDSIGDCHMISSIDLCRCSDLTVLPDSIGKLQKLRTLNLSSCRELKCLPDSIGRNKMLRLLRLSYSKVKRLPSSMTKLENLECLDLQGCRELVELPEGIGNLDKLQVLNLNSCTKLGGIPVGIGQLSRLQRLGLFAIGKGEKFAGMSELANVSRFSEGLTIIGIQHVMDTNDAHVVCLKQKTNLQWLGLEWMADYTKEVNTELQQDVLDVLEPPPGIKKLDIRGYSGRQYAGWMQSQVGGGVQGPAPFPFLRVMLLCDLPNLKHLDGLVELPCLEVLRLLRMPSLESISGGPFPSLVQMEMYKLPRLGEVWMVPERTMPDVEDGGGCYNYNLTPHLGQVRVGSCLSELEINRCPKLEVMPRFPPSLQRLILNGREQMLQSPGQCQGSSSSPSFNKLKKLQLWNVTGLGSGHGWELLQHMTALESLEILVFSGVQTEVPESLWSLTSLRSLKVDHWSNIRMLPESLGELRSLQELTIEFCHSLISLPQTMGQLTSLQLLKIGWCEALHQLPDCLGELCSLRKLEINYLRGLTCLPQSICRLTTSLQELQIYKCPGIKSLPEGIKDLTALKQLKICFCPDLERRCKRGTGEDWHLISHIPDVSHH
ncbi:putative disease resistance protein RGA1 [Miscanthus floridulus]|uniref:putative disease resistance protein RGA1 n=1 Tax=Miscanthus floridulus TaxID=154761 RepID=UPI003459841F